MCAPGGLGPYLFCPPPITLRLAPSNTPRSSERAFPTRKRSAASCIWELAWHSQQGHGIFPLHVNNSMGHQHQTRLLCAHDRIRQKRDHPAIMPRNRQNMNTVHPQNGNHLAFPASRRDCSFLTNHSSGVTLVCPPR